MPILDVYAQAPNAKDAETLANAAVDGLRTYLADLAVTQQIPAKDQLRLLQLGRASGTVINGSVDWQVAILVFILTFSLACATTIFVARVRRGFRVPGSRARAEPRDGRAHVEVIAVFRLLWRRRLLVLLGAILAAGAAYALGPSPTPSRGFASTRVFVDTSRSQLVADDPVFADTLAWRATLAAQTLGTEDNRHSIAAAAGIPPASLDVTDLELTFPIIPASLPRAAVKAAYSSTRPFALNLHTDDVVPIISITAERPRQGVGGPAHRGGRRDARGVYLCDGERGVARAQSPDRHVPIDSVAIPGGQSRKKMAAVFVAVFGMWIAGLTLLPVLLGALRTAFADPDTVRS